jgi:hypothetical protein
VSVGCSLRYGQHYVRMAKETGLTRQIVYRIKDDAVVSEAALAAWGCRVACSHHRNACGQHCDPGNTQPPLLKSNGGSTTHWPSSRSITFT